MSYLLISERLISGNITHFPANADTPGMKMFKKYFFLVTVSLSLNVNAKDMLFKASSFGKKDDLLVIESKKDVAHATCAYNYAFFKTKRKTAGMKQVTIDNKKFYFVSSAAWGKITEYNGMARQIANQESAPEVNILRDEKSYYCHFKMK